MSASERDWLLTNKSLMAVYDVEAQQLKPNAAIQDEPILTKSDKESVSLIGMAVICSGTEMQHKGVSSQKENSTDESPELVKDGGSQGELFCGFKLDSSALSLLPGDASEGDAVQHGNGMPNYEYRGRQASVEGGETVSLTESYDSESRRELADDPSLSKMFVRTASDTESARNELLSATVQSGTSDEKEMPNSHVQQTRAITSDGSNGRPIWAYLLLASAVTGISSIGPLMALQQASTMMKILWRNVAMSIILFPSAALKIHRNGMPSFSMRQWTIVLIAAGCQCAQAGFFNISLEYTTVGNAVLFGTMTALLYIVGKFFAGGQITLSEGIGTLVAFAGAFLCSRDSADGNSDDDTGGQVPAGIKSYFGDFLAFLSSIAYVLYLVFAKQVRASMDASLFMFFIGLFATMECVMFLQLTGLPFSWGTDVNCGLFGWLNTRFDRLPVELSTVIACNLVGIMGYVRCMSYFDNMVLSAVTLMETVVAEFIALLLGVGTLPGWIGWLGQALVTGGTLAVIFKPPAEGQPGRGGSK